MVIANDIHAQVKSLGIPHMTSDVSAFVTVSVGVASARCLPGMTPDMWIDQADRQLYLSKANGRNRVAGRAFSSDFRDALGAPERMRARG